MTESLRAIRPTRRLTGRRRRGAGTTPAPPQGGPTPATRRRPRRGPQRRPPRRPSDKDAAAAAQQPAPADACGCEAGPLPELLGTVNSIRITRADLSSQAQQRVAQLQQEVVERRKGELDRLVNTLLVDAEAKKRNTTPSRLLEAEILNKIPAPTDAEAQAYFNQNKARIEQRRARRNSRGEGERTAFLLEQRQQARAAESRARCARRAGKEGGRECDAPRPPADARASSHRQRRNITSGDVEGELLPIAHRAGGRLHRPQGRLRQRSTTSAQRRGQKRRAVTGRASSSRDTPSRDRHRGQALDFSNKNRRASTARSRPSSTGHSIWRGRSSRSRGARSSTAAQRRERAGLPHARLRRPSSRWRPKTADQGNPNSPSRREFTTPVPACAAARRHRASADQTATRPPGSRPPAQTSGGRQAPRRRAAREQGSTGNCRHPFRNRRA